MVVCFQQYTNQNLYTNLRTINKRIIFKRYKRKTKYPSLKMRGRDGRENVEYIPVIAELLV